MTTTVFCSSWTIDLWLENSWPFYAIYAVLRISDILVQIRIRIRGSRPLTNGSGSGSCYFRHWPSRSQQKTNLKKKLFWFRILLFSSLIFKKPTKNEFKKSYSGYYFLKAHLHHFSKVQSKRCHKSSRNQSFSYYFSFVIERSGAGSGSIPLTNESGSRSRRPKNIRFWKIRIRIRIRITYFMNTI